MDGACPSSSAVCLWFKYGVVIYSDATGHCRAELEASLSEPGTNTTMDSSLILQEKTSR